MIKNYHIKFILVQIFIFYSVLINAGNTKLLDKNQHHQRPNCTTPINSTALQQGSPLWHHVQFFADKDGKLSKDSMKPPHDYLGIKKNVKYKMEAILNILDRRQLSHTTDSLTYVFNPASSGIWDINGNIVESRFNQLAAMAILDNGNQIITKELFNSFLQTIPRDGSEKEVAASVNIIWPFSVDITWDQVTNGSVNELFDYLGNYTLKRNGTIEKAFTVNELRRFYEHSDEYMQDVIDKRFASGQNKLGKCPFALE